MTSEKLRLNSIRSPAPWVRESVNQANGMVRSLDEYNAAVDRSPAAPHDASRCSRPRPRSGPQAVDRSLRLRGPGNIKLRMPSYLIDGITQASIAQGALAHARERRPFVLAGIWVGKHGPEYQHNLHLFAVDSLSTWLNRKATNPYTQEPVEDVLYWRSSPRNPRTFDFVGTHSEAFPPHHGVISSHGAEVRAASLAHEGNPMGLLVLEAMKPSGLANPLANMDKARAQQVLDEATAFVIEHDLLGPYNRLLAGEPRDEAQHVRDFCLAVRSGSANIYATLLRNLHPDTRVTTPSISKNRPTLLMLAAKFGEFPAVRMLLRRGANPALADSANLTAMDYASAPAIKRLLAPKYVANAERLNKTSSLPPPGLGR